MILQVPVSSWFDDMSDTELLDLIPFLETLSKVDNVYTVLQNCNNPLNSCPPPTTPMGGVAINGQTPTQQSPITQVQPPSPASNPHPPSVSGGLNQNGQSIAPQEDSTISKDDSTAS